ncbi:hypothetical protein OG777_22015 [Micromonospora peucetia]|uniref:hypothetical protein n=1 Tax=Micromonospora peucetia TaxID=47871 RepID=UPI00225AF75E|nr:hypothetical protein [Micromonospora peucetia]MCX4389585.1 hypothetical protein [Micromonospora peucetia]
MRETPVRRPVEVPAGGTVVARMPTGAELRNMQLDEDVPVLEIRHPEGATEVLAGNQVELPVPPPADPQSTSGQVPLLHEWNTMGVKHGR